MPAVPAAPHGYRYRARPTPARQDAVIGLGVDGVVALDEPAAVPAHAIRVSAFGRWRRDVVVPEGAAERVAALRRLGEVVWVSPWSYLAHAMLREPLGLPEEPFPFLPAQFDEVEELRLYAAGRPWLLVSEGPVGPLAAGEDAIVLDPHRGLADLDPADAAARVAALDTAGRRRSGQ